METALKDALKVLGLNDATDHPPKMKVVTRRFYELSLIHHPDRPGGDNPLYQVISQAYRFILNVLLDLKFNQYILSSAIIYPYRINNSA